MVFFPRLFTPGQIGRVRLKNRIVMPSMYTGLATIEGEVTAQMIEYYEARARGGAGLVIAEVACVDPPLGRQGFQDLGIDHPRYLAGLNELVEAVHAHQAGAFIQLFHAGRQVSPLVAQGLTPVAPSPLPCKVLGLQPRELSLPEIKILIGKFVQAAAHAQIAGFDGIEIHAAHGYLLSEFLSPYTNRREDNYGGSRQNRMRILLEIIEGIRDKLGDYPISVRLNASDFLPGGIELDESQEIASLLEDAQIDALNISSGMYESGLTSIESVSYPEGWRVYLAETIKQVVSIPVITGGVIRNPQFAEKILEERKADFVFIGRGLLADPDWPNKARQGKTLDIRPCVSCNTCINRDFSGLHIRCAVNPFTGREARFRNENPAPPRKSVLVVGGGPAGLQAAIAFSRRGHSVELVEKSDNLGGLLNLAGLPPHKQRLSLFREYLLQQIVQLPVRISVNTEVNIDLIREKQPDVVVLASGSLPLVPDIEGLHEIEVLDVEDVLLNDQEPRGKQVVVVGGGRNGCEVAEVLALRNNQVTIVEMKPLLAADMEKKNRRDLLERLKQRKISVLTSQQVLTVQDGLAFIHNLNTGQKAEIAAEVIVMATGYAPHNALLEELAKFPCSIITIGDASRVRGLESAILEGEMAAHSLSQ